MEKQKEGTTFPEEFVSRERTFSIHHVHFHAPHRRMYNTWHGKAVRIDADCGSFHSYQTLSTPSCAFFHALLFSRIERETLSLSLSALSSATFLIKRPLRTVSSLLARNIKIPGRRSRAGSIGVTSSRRNRRGQLATRSSL